MENTIMAGLFVPFLDLLSQFWSWLISGLYPPPMLLIFISFVIIAATAIFLNLIDLLPSLIPIIRSVIRVLLYPIVEELTCRIFLVGCIMTVLRPCAAPQTTVLCGTIFGLMHIITAIKSIPPDPLRVVDGLIVGYFNTIVCLVCLRYYIINIMHTTLADLLAWVVVYFALLFFHIVYNLLVEISKLIPIFRIGIVIFGIIFTIAAWFAFMPMLQ